MRSLLALVGCTALSSATYGQGYIHFFNTPATLISGGGVPMPTSTNLQFIFAAFLAPASTIETANVQVGFSDLRFQAVEAYNTNHPVGPGRLVNRSYIPINYGIGLPVDFVVRGWSANAGATWSEALANWNNGSPLVPMFIGSSTVGNDLWIAGDLPMSPLFGINPAAGQVPGFDMTFVPEPSALTLAGLGLGAIWLLCRRSH